MKEPAATLLPALATKKTPQVERKEEILYILTRRLRVMVTNLRMRRSTLGVRRSAALIKTSFKAAKALAVVQGPEHLPQPSLQVTVFLCMSICINCALCSEMK